MPSSQVNFKEDRQKVAAELRREGNVRVQAFERYYAFPPWCAPPGKEIGMDDELFFLFVDFHFLLHKNQHGTGRRLVAGERVKRGWPQTLDEITKGGVSANNFNKVPTNKAGLPGQDKRVETGNALGQKPINPSTSHVKEDKYSGLRFSRKIVNASEGSKSGNVTQDGNPHFTPLLPPPTISKEIRSYQTMQEPDFSLGSRASSPLSECSDWSAVDARLVSEASPGGSTVISENVLPPQGEAVTPKREHIKARVKNRRNHTHNVERRVSARLKDSLPKPLSTPSTRDGPTQRKVATREQKTVTNNFIQTNQVEATIPVVTAHQSLTMKRERSGSQLLESAPRNPGHTTNGHAHALSGGDQQQARISVGNKKTSSNHSLQMASTSQTKSLSRKQRAFAVKSERKSVSVPLVVQKDPRREDNTSHFKEQSDGRQLRPRPLAASTQSVGKSPAISNPPLKRSSLETHSNSNKKRRLSKNGVSNVKGQTSLGFSVVKHPHSTKLSRKPSLLAEGTRNQKKVAENLSTKKAPNPSINGKFSQQGLCSPPESVATSTVKVPLPRQKRKRTEQPVVVDNKVESGEHLSNPIKIDDPEPPSKRRKRHPRKSAKKINRDSGNNRRVPLPLEILQDSASIPQTSLPQTNSESDIQIKADPAGFTPEDHAPRHAQIVDLPNTPKTDLVERAVPIHPTRDDDTGDNGPAVTKPLKEEILETSILAKFRPSPIHGPSFQEYDEELDPLPSDDLIFLDESEKQFTYPDEHPDNFCRFPKPPLQVLPSIWAESRQELCESFDWFRSYQGGVYHAHNATKGYLLSGFPASRDRFEHGGRLIISHGGGKAESIHSHKGRLEAHPATDQLAQDKSVRALFDNFVNNRPLALVMDDKYALFPYDLKAKNVTYAVLGFYTIAHAWAEYQSSNNEAGRVIRYKFAFRWCDDQGPPWWEQPAESTIGGQSNTGMIIGSKSLCPNTFPVNLIPNTGIRPGTQEETMALDEVETEGQIGSSNDVSKFVIGGCLDQQCSSCSKTSVQIFAAWTCLNPQCFKFWRSDNGRPLPVSMGYNPKFLELGPSKPIPAGFGSLTPQSALAWPLPDIMKTVYPYTRGFHCSKCGRLSCRDKWEQWQCLNPSCNFILEIKNDSRAAESLLHQTAAIAFKDYALNPISDIQQLLPASFKHDKGRGVIQTFILPYKNAKIHHIKSGNFLGRQDADSIFIDYQEQATRGELKFRRWPMRAHKCRGSLLTNYFSQNTGEPYKYVGGDENTVSFEKAPGAVVRARDLIQRRVTQALGTPVEFNEVLSAAYMERQRMAFHSDDEVGLGPLVAGLSLGSPALMHFRLLAKHDVDREKRGILLSIVLRHGDILVMDGAAVQEYYEHTVVPTNFRIAATARYIGADHA